MPRSPANSACRTGDIDIDRDGLETFCDSVPEDDVKRVDTCIDGDGTVVLDGDNGVQRCTDALDASGQRRFVDGVTATFTATALPATIQ